MFNTISWQSYWIAIALSSVLYYAMILWLYFRPDLYSWLSRKQQRLFRQNSGGQSASHGKGTVQPSLFGEVDFDSPAPGTNEHFVYACMDELNAFFESAKARKWSSAGLVYAIRLILSKYPAIRESEYKHSLEQVILTQCELHCSIHLKAEEAVGLWL